MAARAARHERATVDPRQAPSGTGRRGLRILPAMDERLERYAELLVRAGANVQSGQELVIIGQPEHAETVRAVARAAYRAGARRVVRLVRAIQFIRRAPRSSSGRPSCRAPPQHLLAGSRAG